MKVFHLLLTGLLLTIVFSLFSNVTQAKELSNEQLAYEIEMRRSLGFRSDEDYVRQLHNSNSSVQSEMAGDIPFTQEEIIELETRIRFESELEAIDSVLSQNFPSIYGGIYVDHAPNSEGHENGGHIVIVLVEEIRSIQELLPTIVSLSFPERIKFQDGDYNYKHLRHQFTLVSEEMKHLQGQISSVSEDIPSNRIVVHVTGVEAEINADQSIAKDTLPRSLSELLADEAIIVYQGKLNYQPTAVNAGEGWTDEGLDVNCTLGFKVQVNGYTGMVTAGHCFWNGRVGQFEVINKEWTSTSIGEGTNLVQVGGLTDSAIIKLDSSGTATDDVVNYSGVRDVTGEVLSSSYSYGNWRCFSGRTSGTKCGIITCSSVSIGYLDQFGQYFTAQDAYTVDPKGQGGDSGAPGYRPDSGNTASAVGIHAGTVSYNPYSGPSCINGYDAIQSKWHNIKNQWGLTLVTN